MSGDSLNADELRIIRSTYPPKNVTAEELQVIENLRLEDESEEKAKEALEIVNELGPQLITFARTIKQALSVSEKEVKWNDENSIDLVNYIKSASRSLEDHFDELDFLLETAVTGAEIDIGEAGNEFQTIKSEFLSDLLYLGALASILFQRASEGSL
jgi:hypothetical protein